MLGAARGDLAEEDYDAFSYARVSFSSPGMPDLLCRPCDVRHVFSQRGCSGRGTTRPLFGLIWPKGGYASTPEPQRRRIDFLPLG